MASRMRACASSPNLVVGARPGSTRFTRTLNCCSSSASDSVNALTAALLAVYTDSKGSGIKVTLDVTLITTPARRSLNCGSTACVIAMVPSASATARPARSASPSVAMSACRRRDMCESRWFDPRTIGDLLKPRS